MIVHIGSFETLLPKHHKESFGPGAEGGDAEPPPFRFTYDDGKSSQEPSSKRHALVYEGIKRDLPTDKKVPKAAVACEFCKSQ